jgi:DmsE family decaheme c-type cytochrome
MPEKSRKWFYCLAVALIATLAAASIAGQVEPESGPPQESAELPPTEEYSRRGADACILCHSESMPQPATAIFSTPHASMTDPDTPFSNFQCETCHGPGKDHARSQRAGGGVLPVFTFGTGAATPPPEQNEICLGCHESHGRLGWFGSTHEAEEVPCAACHQIHRERDRVFDALAQQEACFGCHQRRRSDTFKPSSHPLRFGTMGCSDCHDPHNGNNEFLLKQPTINETCYTCHTEKRGPFLWEHAPASEDCTLCHDPHGSNHDALLVKRPPLLCQQCHSSVGHPSVGYTSELVENDFNNRFLLGRSCLNCHSQVHGSNHPSGVTLHR